MTNRQWVAVAAVVVLAAAGCQRAYMLELDVVNESSGAVVIEVLGPGGGDAGFREIVEPRSEVNLSLERPGPGGWSITVDDQVATDAGEWPDDNPTIDLTIVIEADGSILVRDT
jgi:hypothetical protein